MLDGSAGPRVLDAEDVCDGVASDRVSKHDGSGGVAAGEDLCG